MGIAFFDLHLGAVILAAGLDVAANLMLVRSQGFRRRLFGVLALTLVGLAFVALTYAVQSMDLAVAYALWGGFGILGTSLGGWLLFGQRLQPGAWIGMALLVGGMAVLRLSPA